MDCSLGVEMTQPDSINDIDFESFSMIGKQMERAEYTTFCLKAYTTICSVGMKKGKAILTLPSCRFKPTLAITES